MLEITNIDPVTLFYINYDEFLYLLSSAESVKYAAYVYNEKIL